MFKQKGSNRISLGNESQKLYCATLAILVFVCFPFYENIKGLVLLPVFVNVVINLIKERCFCDIFFLHFLKNENLNGE